MICYFIMGGLIFAFGITVILAFLFAAVFILLAGIQLIGDMIKSFKD